MKSSVMAVPPVARRSLLLIVVALLNTAAVAYTPKVPGPCPSDFANECGAVDCSAVSSSYAAEVDNYDPLPGNNRGSECEEGTDGGADAIDAGDAYWVWDWGSCDYGGGAHFYSSNTVLVDAYADEETALSTFWHEGWSYYQGCIDALCHDDGFMDDLWSDCYISVA